MDSCEGTSARKVEVIDDVANEHLAFLTNLFELLGRDVTTDRVSKWKPSYRQKMRTKAWRLLQSLKRGHGLAPVSVRIANAKNCEEVIVALGLTDILAGMIHFHDKQAVFNEFAALLV